MSELFKPLEDVKRWATKIQFFPAFLEVYVTSTNKCHTDFMSGSKVIASKSQN